MNKIFLKQKYIGFQFSPSVAVAFLGVFLCPFLRALEAHYIMHWPADLVVSSSRVRDAGFSLPNSHPSDMTEILL